MIDLTRRPRHAEEQRRRFIDQGPRNDDTLATDLEKWARPTPDKRADWQCNTIRIAGRDV